MTRKSASPPLPPFERLIDRHGRGLLRFCVARLGADRGEDAFQETLLAALRAYPDLRDPHAAGGWLFAIADRKIIDAVRAAAKAPVTAGSAGDEPGAPLSAAAEGSEAWLDGAAADGLWSEVASLPPRQREAVALRYVADLSHGDIAAAMGISAEAARRNVHEGLKRLRGSVTR